jgi:phosphatidylglycerol---prolipoprotein diacylglyceryl transferase
MKPTLLSFPHISSYPVLLLLGCFFGWILARRLAARKGFEVRHIDNLALLIPVVGLAGARFFARLFYAKLPLWEALQVWKGDGLVFYGGFLASFGAVLIYCWIHRVKVLELLDSLAPAAALGLCFGRIGCFLAGCCWGDICLPQAQLAGLPSARVAQIQTFPNLSTSEMPLAVRFPPRSDVYKTQVKWGLLAGTEERSFPVHPVQLYEAGLALALCLLLWVASKQQAPPGRQAIALLLGYAAIRFCTEYFRGDNSLGFGGFTVSQMISVYLALFALLFLIFQYFWTAQKGQLLCGPVAKNPRYLG